MTTETFVKTALIPPDIRRLWAKDKPLLLRYFRRLDAETQRLRFGADVPDAFLKDYVEETLSFDGLVYGAFVNGMLRGVGELRLLLGRWPSCAEVAFSVEPAWQAEGIGDALFARLLTSSRNRGVRTLFMQCLRDNTRMQNLARKHAAYLRFDIGEVEATLDPPWPTPLSLAEEMLGHTSRYFRAVFDLPE